MLLPYGWCNRTYATWLEIHWPRRYVDETGQVRWLPMFRYRARLIDPNRNPTVGIELGSKVEFIQPDRVADTQMQITTSFPHSL
jgi:hypothetical protein